MCAIFRVYFYYIEKNIDILAQITQQGDRADLERGKEQYYSNIILACGNMNILYETLKKVQKTQAAKSEEVFFDTAIQQVAGIIDQLSGSFSSTKNPLVAQTPAGLMNAIESGAVSVSMKYGLRTKVEELLSDLAVQDGVVDVEI